MKSRSAERASFDKKTYEASQNGDSNYSGANPGRTTLSDKEAFDSDRNARHSG
jgi:hypothetical protein